MVQWFGGWICITMVRLCKVFALTSCWISIIWWVRFLNLSMKQHDKSGMAMCQIGTWGCASPHSDAVRSGFNLRFLSWAQAASKILLVLSTPRYYRFCGMTICPCIWWRFSCVPPFATLVAPIHKYVVSWMFTSIHPFLNAFIHRSTHEVKYVTISTTDAQSCTSGW